MEELMRGKIQAYYGTDTKKLYLGDCLELLRKMKPESVDMIFADPPYFLSNNGITCQGGRMVSVNKASWDEGGDFKENHAFNRRWIRMCRRVLKRAEPYGYPVPCTIFIHQDGASAGAV